MRRAFTYMVTGAIAGLVAPLGLLAYGLLGGTEPDPLLVFTVMSVGGVVALGAAGLVVGRQDDALRAKNRDLANLSAELERRSLTDALTRIPNRRSFDERIAIETARVERYGGPLALVMIDLDLFKSLNDRFGHRVGDDVLRRVAALVEAERRGGDLVARYGGEEIAAILPHTGLEAAAAWSERVRRRIAAEVIASDAGPVAVTASFGVASVGPAPATADALVTAADSALYEAKALGRNRVCVYTERPAQADGPACCAGSL